MTKQFIYIVSLFLIPFASNCQEVKIDTLTRDNQNVHFIQFIGTWYDNIWDNPVMRGFSLSRTKKDSSRFSLTFNADGSISSENFKDSFKILDSTNWWYDGKYIYFKHYKDSLYTAKRVFKYKDGNVIIANRPSGWFLILRPSTSKSILKFQETATDIQFCVSRANE